MQEGLEIWAHAVSSDERAAPTERAPKTVSQEFWIRKLLTDGLCQPAPDNLGYFPTVLLEHQHVTVAMDAGFAKLDPGGMNSGLFEELDGAMVVGCMVGRLGGHD